MTTSSSQYSTSLPVLVAGDSRQPSLILLHGFMGCKEDFAPLLPALGEHFYCWAIDLPGHGAARDLVWGWQETAAHLADLRWRISPHHSSYLCGYSMGGRIALYSLVQYPHHWQGAVLESACGGLADPEQRHTRLQQDLAIARKLRRPDVDWPAFISAWYQQPMFAGLADHPSFPQIYQRRLTGDPPALGAALERFSLGHQPDLVAALPPCPLLLLAGALDPKYVALQRALADRAAGATLGILDNCSHNLHAQAPELWLQWVIPWLSKLPIGC